MARSVGRIPRLHDTIMGFVKRRPSISAEPMRLDENTVVTDDAEYRGTRIRKKHSCKKEGPAQ